MKKIWMFTRHKLRVFLDHVVGYIYTHTDSVTQWNLSIRYNRFLNKLYP
jgi:hypothetical protein